MSSAQEYGEGGDTGRHSSSPGCSSRREWLPLSRDESPTNLRTLSFSERNNPHARDHHPSQRESPPSSTMREPGAFLTHENSADENLETRRNSRSRHLHFTTRGRPPVMRSGMHRQTVRNRAASLQQNGSACPQQVMTPYFVSDSPTFAIQGMQILTTPQRPIQQANIVTNVPCTAQVGATSPYYPPPRIRGNSFTSAEFALMSPPQHRLSIPSTSTSASATTSRGRKKAWWVVNCFTERLDQDGHKFYVCLACEAKRSSKQSASRLAEHVWKCRKVDEAVKKRLFEESQHIRSVVRTFSGEGQSRTEGVDGANPPRKRHKGNCVSQSLAAQCSEEEADEISMKLVRAVVECCLPFTIFDSTSNEGKSFREMIFKARPGYKDMYPSRHSVMVKFLPRLCNKTYDVVKRSLKQMLSTGYGTIIFDGWDDINRSSVVNVLLRVESKSVRKSFFLDSVFTGYARVGATEYVKIIEKVMGDFGGLQRVCGVASDSARACVNARNALARKYPGLIGIQDQAHVADLLMKDIGKLDFVRDILDKVNMLVVETRGKRKFLSFVRQAMKRENLRLRREMDQVEADTQDVDVSLPSDPMHPDLLFPPLRKTAVMLRKPSSTRFASMSDTLEAFIRTRDVLYQVIGDRQFERHLFPADKPEQEMRRETYKELVGDLSFLDSVKEIHNVFRLCRRYLRVFDREKGTSVSDVVPSTESLGEALTKVPTSSAYLTPERLEMIRSIFKKRKDGPIGRSIQVRLIEDVHIAAYLLHPTKFPADYQRYDQRFYSFVKRHVESIICSSDSVNQDDEEDSGLVRARVALINKIMNDYDVVHSRWMLSTSEDASGTPRGRMHVHYELAFRTTPMRFWMEEARVGTCPELCELALRTLSVSPSSCSAERSFSVQGRIRTKLRNRLGESVVRKMMFVKWNIRHYDEITQDKKEEPRKDDYSTRKDNSWLFSDDRALGTDASDSEDSSEDEELNIED